MPTTTKELYIDGPKKSKSKASIPDLPANAFVFEIFDVITKQRTKVKKVEALKKFNHPSLKALFIWNFDETIISLLPPGEVPYAGVDEQNVSSGTVSGKIDDAVNKMAELGSNSLGAQDQGRTSIRQEFKKFYNFLQ